MQHYVNSAEDIERALTAPVALLYKHSETCPVSAMAQREIDRLEHHRPDLDIWVVDVHAHRALSREIAERFTIRHESPQAILVRDGAAVWHSSHYGVTARAIEGELREG